MTAETVVEKGLACTSWAMEEEGARGHLLLLVLLMALYRSNNFIEADNLLLIQLLPYRVKQYLLLFPVVISHFPYSTIFQCLICILPPIQDGLRQTKITQGPAVFIQELLNAIESVVMCQTFPHIFPSSWSQHYTCHEQGRQVITKTFLKLLPDGKSISQGSLLKG